MIQLKLLLNPSSLYQRCCLTFLLIVAFQLLFIAGVTFQFFISQSLAPNFQKKSITISHLDSNQPMKARNVENLIKIYTKGSTSQKSSELPQLPPLNLLTPHTSEKPISPYKEKIPKSIQVLLEDADQFSYAGDTMAALRKLSEALKKEPRNPLVLYKKGLLYENIKLWNQAAENYQEIFNMGPKAGSFYLKSSKKLSLGAQSDLFFNAPIKIGRVREQTSSKRLKTKLTIPIIRKPTTEIIPDDIHVKIYFYDWVNNQRIEPVPSSRSSTIKYKWLGHERNWEDGQRLLRSSYSIPTADETDRYIFGNRKFYGFCVELYYQNELVDLYSNPRTLAVTHVQTFIQPIITEPALNNEGSLLPIK